MGAQAAILKNFPSPNGPYKAGQAGQAQSKTDRHGQACILGPKDPRKRKKKHSAALTFPLTKWAIHKPDRPRTPENIKKTHLYYPQKTAQAIGAQAAI